MKKILAIVLSLIMALGMAALAETATTEKTDIGSLEVNGEFTLKAAIPEGYTIIPGYTDSQLSLWEILSEDETKPIMTLVIAFDEAYADVYRLNDLPDEQIKDLIATWGEYEAEITMPETAYGTKLIQVVETGDYTDFVSFFAIYQGYCIEFTMYPNFENGETNLTREQIAKCIDFLSDLDFVPVEG